MFVAAGEIGALDGVTTAPDPGVIGAAGVVLEGLEISERRFCTVDLAVADAMTA